MTDSASDPLAFLEGASGVAGLFERAWQDPALRPMVLMGWRLLDLQQQTRAKLQELQIPLDALVEGFDAPGLKEWLASTSANEADRRLAFETIMFNEDLRAVERALARGDYRTVATTLAPHVYPPFGLADRVGGRKRIVTPRIRAVLQAWAEIDWRKSPRLSKSQLAEKYRPMLAWLHEELRLEEEPPSARTIRSYLLKPDWLKSR